MSTVLATDPPDPLVGRIIDGKYRVLQPLGEGGMAQVYTAEHLLLGHLVAIKFLRRELAVDSEIAERFAREAKTIAQLNSEHIVKVLDVGHFDGAGPFMVMEHLDGEDLQTRLDRNGPLPLAEAIGYVMQAAMGLEQAHQKGIVHRDLKPGNLFLARSERDVETIKLLDFGISKQSGASSLTQPQVAMGSPNYMAPEQLLGHGTIDGRADVWSLGVVLYRLTTGTAPFTGQSIAEVFARILHTDPKQPSDVRAGLPRAFDELVLRCLKKPAEERPPNVRALAAALREIVSPPSHSRIQVMVDRSSTVDPVSVTTRLGVEPVSGGRRWRLAAAVGCLLFAALGPLAFATNSLSVRADPLAEPLALAAECGVDESGSHAPVARAPGAIAVADLPLEPATETPAPRTADARAPKPAALVQNGSDKPARPPAAFVLHHAAGRTQAAPRPPRPNSELAVSDFGGRR
jgi:serine/threonine-protein kinase